MLWWVSLPGVTAERGPDNVRVSARAVSKASVFPRSPRMASSSSHKQVALPCRAFLFSGAPAYAGSWPAPGRDKQASCFLLRRGVGQPTRANAPLRGLQCHRLRPDQKADAPYNATARQALNLRPLPTRWVPPPMLQSAVLRRRRPWAAAHRARVRPAIHGRPSGSACFLGELPPSVGAPAVHPGRLGLPALVPRGRKPRGGLPGSGDRHSKKQASR